MYGGNPTSYGYPLDPINSIDLDGNWGNSRFMRADVGGAGGGYYPRNRYTPGNGVWPSRIPYPYKAYRAVRDVPASQSWNGSFKRAWGYRIDYKYKNRRGKTTWQTWKYGEGRYGRWNESSRDCQR